MGVYLDETYVLRVLKVRRLLADYEGFVMFFMNCFNIELTVRCIHYTITESLLFRSHNQAERDNGSHFHQVLKQSRKRKRFTLSHSYPRAMLSLGKQLFTFSYVQTMLIGIFRLFHNDDVTILIPHINDSKCPLLIITL